MQILIPENAKRKKRFIQNQKN